MLPLPRLAVGSVHAGVNAQPMCWALLALSLARAARAAFLLDGVLPSVGWRRERDGGRFAPPGQLVNDARRLPRSICAWRGGANVAIVEGRYESTYERAWHGGKLDELCDWLDLPRVAVIDARAIGDCQLPARPAQADAVLLDHVRDLHHFARLQTALEALWGVPVLGALESMPQVRSALAALPRGARAQRDTCQQLAAGLARYARLDRLLNLAARRAFPATRPFIFSDRARRGGATLTVAVAYDEAFRCYFADALELLELSGASVIDFSPLRNEALPSGTDLVYLGCGHPERHAATLAENHCMRFALREHLCRRAQNLCRGGRIGLLVRTYRHARGGSPADGRHPAGRGGGESSSGTAGANKRDPGPALLAGAARDARARVSELELVPGANREPGGVGGGSRSRAQPGGPISGHRQPDARELRDTAGSAARLSAAGGRGTSELLSRHRDGP